LKLGKVEYGGGWVWFALVRGRGLKPVITLVTLEGGKFALVRGRGLKPPNDRLSILASGGSPSCEGAD